MPIKTRDFVRLLRRKFGFVPCTTHGDDHDWYELTLPEMPTILTRVSHVHQSPSEISDVLLGLIARQLRVRAPYCRGMFQCTNSREDYYRQIRSDPYPPVDVLRL